MISRPDIYRRRETLILGAIAIAAFCVAIDSALAAEPDLEKICKHFIYNDLSKTLPNGARVSWLSFPVPSELRDRFNYNFVLGFTTLVAGALATAHAASITSPGAKAPAV